MFKQIKSIKVSSKRILNARLKINKLEVSLKNGSTGLIRHFKLRRFFNARMFQSVLSVTILNIN